MPKTQKCPLSLESHPLTLLLRLAPTGQPSGQPLPVWLASGHCSSHSGPPTEQPFGASIFPWKREKSQNGCPRRRQPFLLQRADSLTPHPPVPTRFVPHQFCHSQIGCTVGDTSVLWGQATCRLKPNAHLAAGFGWPPLEAAWVVHECWVMWTKKLILC